MDRPITVVCGFGRCGSSLVMQMLAAGGMPCVGEAPAYEIPEVMNLPASWEFLEELPGKAVKILDPHLNTPKPGPAYRFIWVDRHPGEQARSIAKFLQVISGMAPLSRNDRKKLQRSLGKDRPLCLNLLARLGGKPPLAIAFESILANPDVAGRRLSDFCGGLDSKAMAAVVRPRPPQCLPYMLEAELLKEAVS